MVLMAGTATKKGSSRTSARRKPTKPGTATVARSGQPTGAIRNFRAALQFLNSQTNYEKMLRVGYNQTNFNLSRMQRILDAVGNPHKKIRCAHIAGTKGKGSTCHMLAGMMQNCGYRTGLYTSPHIMDIRERIAINGHLISEAEFTRLIAKLAPVVKRLANARATLAER